ncbi:WecB/TagA/CpsF family glycosyltransferase [Sporosarcina saromensis]|uniref:N-acetylglucosaminyldiphosphoundecaprenol N-acetyl-beta-D-mannosaminyltransferase n=1 Tax=Sporosarcina saromensis TaxID=359365 RepID=A0ABU4GAN5_9BACL|nr:WecB/TagA/CpsF family glycosyltransferase [Sporosarcina saromensis]MDW0114035.1 WecB/TagA/CpsF family glycosyltransferase [Sporosarcina saromensis]
MKEYFLSVSVSPLTYEEIITELRIRINEEKQSTIIAVNPEKVMTAQKNPEVKDLINASTFQIADGVGILLASKLKKGQVKERVTGVEMMSRLLEFAASDKLPVYFYGAKEEVVKKAIENIKNDIPNLQVAGYSNGYRKDEKKLVSEIDASGAKMIFVALGSPTQELWIKRNIDQLRNVLVFQGVGGSFDVFSGTVKRAPLFFRKLGLEWFYRLLREPKRLKRQLNLPLFLWKVLRDRGN